MIKGVLRKFEPTEKGITVVLQCDKSQMQQIVDMWDKEVGVDLPGQEAVSVDETHARIMRAMEAITDYIGTQSNQVIETGVSTPELPFVEEL